MRGVDEGNEWRTTYIDKEEGGREIEREMMIERMFGRSGSLPLLLMIIKLVCV